MNDYSAKIFSLENSDAREKILNYEWLTTNGIGGYASATVGRGSTRRYHGLLIASLPAPLGRVVMLNELLEYIRLPGGERIALAGDTANPAVLREFRLYYRIPIWRFIYQDYVLEKRVVLTHGQNTVHVTYQLLSPQDKIELELHPCVQFRMQENEVNQAPLDYALSIQGNRYEISTQGLYPALRLTQFGSRIDFIYRGGERREVFYPTEGERGYSSRGPLWTPGYFQCELRSQQDVSLVASTEPWNQISAIKPITAYHLEIERSRHLLCLPAPGGDGNQDDLVLAADQFIISPMGRVEDVARARAVGDEVRTIIAGYYWFTDWGRDTMISLEGLTLTTQRFAEAEWILRMFALHVRDGLIPNMFPEGESSGLYHTADATLWFFQAVERYVTLSGDRNTLRHLLPILLEILKLHESGTLYHIKMDLHDHLLHQGQEGYQLTWMDAKMGDWVVTPRRGKAVEINALWYNALRLAEKWLREENRDAEAPTFAELADQVKLSFNQRFWNKEKNHLFDVIDGENGNDAACRPNQIFSLSLSFPVLEREHWESVVESVRTKLLTPYGLRSLSPDHPDYKSQYFGDLRSRDAAYHQGTVWGWLIGPYIDAWLLVYPEKREEAKQLLLPLCQHLNDTGLGSISEVFDAEPPYTPRGCIAQAWSVAELLRSWKKVMPKDGLST